MSGTFYENLFTDKRFIDKSLCGNPFRLFSFLYYLTTPDRIYVPTTCTNKELGCISDYCEEFYKRKIGTEAVQMSEDLRKLNKVCFNFFKYGHMMDNYSSYYKENKTEVYRLEICSMSGLNIKKDETGTRSKYIKTCSDNGVNPFYFIVPQMEISSGSIYTHSIIILKDPILELLISTPEERKKDSKYFYYLCQCLFELYFKLYAIMNDMSMGDASNTKFLRNTMFVIFLASIRSARKSLLHRGEIEGIVQSDEEELNHLDFAQLLTDVLFSDDKNKINYAHIEDAIKELEFCMDRLDTDAELTPLAMANIITNLIDLEIVP